MKPSSAFDFFQDVGDLTSPGMCMRLYRPWWCCLSGYVTWRGAWYESSQIAYIGGPPKTRQFFRPHPPADSQRIRWWDAGKMAIGLCHVPLAESAQTASGWASGHGRHAGGFRSRQAGSDGQPALHQRISFEPDGHKRDPPVRRPFITLAVSTIRCFFPWFLFLLTF